ncbi:MAG: hypothetical protein FWG20_07085 [Candidatus Cloacimonetes bacterium]|nr:hypothetical protein [Candidatus Cloacimonadota bacterium]
MDDVTYKCKKCKKLGIKEVKECWYCGSEIVPVKNPIKAPPHPTMVKLRIPLFIAECVMFIASITGQIFFLHKIQDTHIIFMSHIFTLFCFGVIALWGVSIRIFWLSRKCILYFILDGFLSPKNDDFM